MHSELKITIKNLPHKPGVYQYFDKNEKLLYIGKAKNLRKRVQSYFNKEHDEAKTRILVRQIFSLRFIVVETEYDALLLENNLIKKYQPKYNILLKDDKTYPWICIKKEAFPRIFKTRRLIRDGSEYFGPYANAKVAYALLELLREVYPLRTCNLDLSDAKIAQGKHKVCLEYHIGNCKGPCEGLQTKNDYELDIRAIRNILKGNFKEVLVYMHKLMDRYAAELAFEQAQSIKDKIALLENYQSKSTVVSPTITNVDVFSIKTDETHGFVNYLKINNGAIIQSFTTEIKKKLNETDEELLTKSIIDIRGKFQSISREIYTSIPLSLEIPGVKMLLPKIGDKKRIVDLSLRNAKYYRMDRLKKIQLVDPDRHAKRIMAQMKKDLRLPAEPRHIEGFDNSNLQGTNPVSACVVFKDGKPSKRDYRKYNIKTVVGPDDYASMEEVVYRRYKRLLEEEQDLPQLIVIDGGKGQLSSAVKSLEKLGLRGKISILGIAKRLEEIYFPNDSIPLYLDKTSETLKVLQHIRNESHRFGIEHHRDRRSKNGFSSELEGIPGVGEKTITELLKKFGSVKGVKNAKKKELEAVIGVARSRKVMEYFANNTNA